MSTRFTRAEWELIDEGLVLLVDEINEQIELAKVQGTYDSSGVERREQIMDLQFKVGKRTGHA